jgi:hypothetical protein
MGVRLEGSARHFVVQLHVPLRHRCSKVVGQVGHRLAGSALEPVVHEPLADKLFGELALRLAPPQSLLVAVLVVVAGRVRRVDLVDENQVPVHRASELVLRVHEEKALLGGHLGAAPEKVQGPVGELVVRCGVNIRTFDSLVPRHVLVVALLRFRRGGEDRLWKLLALPEALR